LSTQAERKLDYLSFTVKDSSVSHDEICSLLNVQFQEQGFGRYRYRKSARALAGGLCVYWDGVTEEMGTHVQISGEGCRLLEGLPEFPSWTEWVSTWLDQGAKFTRFDLAIDDLGGRIAFETVLGQIQNRTAVTRAACYSTQQTVTRKGTFQTLYLGRRSSETFMRCYDKGMQLDTGASWLRFEFEYKGRRADAIARLFATEGWDAAAGVARSFIEFKDESHVTTDRTRQRPAAWWVDLISASKHVLNVSKEAHASLVRSWGWLQRQVAPIIGVMMEHEGGDISWVCELADQGKSRWHERHLQMLRDGAALPGLEAS
jgi:phage replication initiation protein